jgi:hypothetical protein
MGARLERVVVEGRLGHENPQQVGQASPGVELDVLRAAPRAEIGRGSLDRRSGSFGAAPCPDGAARCCRPGSWRCRASPCPGTPRPAAPSPARPPVAAAAGVIRRSVNAGVAQARATAAGANLEQLHRPVLALGRGLKLLDHRVQLRAVQLLPAIELVRVRHRLFQVVANGASAPGGRIAAGQDPIMRSDRTRGGGGGRGGGMRRGYGRARRVDGFLHRLLSLPLIAAGRPGPRQCLKNELVTGKGGHDAAGGREAGAFKSLLLHTYDCRFPGRRHSRGGRLFIIQPILAIATTCQETTRCCGSSTSRPRRGTTPRSLRAPAPELFPRPAAAGTSRARLTRPNARAAAGPAHRRRRGGPARCRRRPRQGRVLHQGAQGGRGHMAGGSPGA